jgi:hypothetical protein
MKNFNDIKTFFVMNFLYFIFGAYFAYMLGYYFFSENIFGTQEFAKGYILGGDSFRYIDGANQIINFKMPNNKGVGYLGYIFYIAIFQYFKLDLTIVILSQILFSFISSLCIFKITKKFSSHTGGVFALSLYLFYFPLQKWNFYILTETLFICLVIFIVYLFIFFKKKYLYLLIFLIIFYMILRPHGVILIPCLVLSLLVYLYSHNKLKLFYLMIIGLLIFAFPILYLLNGYIKNEKVINSLISNVIIWGYENKSDHLEFKNSNINNDLMSLLIFYKNNFYLNTIGFFKKIFFFYFSIRPFYSDFHNYYLILLNLIYWPTAILGMFKLYNKNNLGITLVYFLIIFFSFAVGLTWVDWDGRFFHYILPLIFIFSGIGFHNMFFNKIDYSYYK